MASAIAVAAGGLSLVAGAGAASASPVPGVPLTTADLCTAGGGTVTTTAPGVQRCRGGGDTGDVIVGPELAGLLSQTVPRPPVPSPSLP